MRGSHCGGILRPVLKPTKPSAHCNVEFQYQLSIYPTTEENHKNSDNWQVAEPSLKLVFISIIQKLQFLRHREQSVSIRKTKQLMLFREE
jgi:hypothetical protein